MYAHRAGLPILANYMDAVAHFDEQIPYKRGRDKGKVPLGSNRRYSQCTIEKGEDEVSLHLYGYKVVAYRADGTIMVTLACFDTHSTRSFITCSTPFTAFAYGGVSYLKVGDNEYAFPSGDYEFIIKDRQVLNPQRETVFRLNRSALLEVTKPYRPFLEYVEHMGKVMTIIKDTEVIAANETMPDYAMRNFIDGRGNGRVINRLHIPQASSRYARNVEPHPLELISTFLEKTLAACEEEDLQVFYQHFLWLGASALTWSYYLKGFVCSRDSDNTIGKLMVQFFKELLRHRYRDQVFIKEEIVSTKATKNENRKYFR